MIYHVSSIFCKVDLTETKSLRFVRSDNNVNVKISLEWKCHDARFVLVNYIICIFLSEIYFISRFFLKKYIFKSYLLQRYCNLSRLKNKQTGYDNVLRAWQYLFDLQLLSNTALIVTSCVSAVLTNACRRGHASLKPETIHPESYWARLQGWVLTSKYHGLIQRNLAHLTLNHIINSIFNKNYCFRY